MLKYALCVPRLSRTLTMKGCWILPKISLYLMIRWFVFESIYVTYNIYWFMYVDLSLYSCNEPKLVMMNAFWYDLGFNLPVFYWDFCNHVHQRYWSAFYIFCYAIIWFWWQGNIGAKKKVFGSFPSFLILWNNLSTIVDNSLKFCCEPSGPEFR